MLKKDALFTQGFWQGGLRSRSISVAVHSYAGRQASTWVAKLWMLASAAFTNSAPGFGTVARCQSRRVCFEARPWKSSASPNREALSSPIMFGHGKPGLTAGRRPRSWEERTRQSSGSRTQMTAARRPCWPRPGTEPLPAAARTWTGAQACGSRRQEGGNWGGKAGRAAQTRRRRSHPRATRPAPRTARLAGSGTFVTVSISPPNGLFTP